MFPLNQNSKLEAFLGSSPASNIQWSVGYIDLPPQTSAATEQQRGNTFPAVSNGTSDVTICPYPGQNSSTATGGQPAWVRNVLYAKGYNPNASAVTATIQINNGSDDIQWTGPIPAGGLVYYEDKKSWIVMDANGNILVSQGLINSSQVVGTTTNDNAAAGRLGEYVSSSQSSPTNFPSSGAWGDLVSISLTAGDWDVSSAITANENGGTTSEWRAGISTTSGNNGSGLVVGDNRLDSLPPSASANASLSIPVWRLSLSATTTVYLKYFALFITAAPQARGRLSARRMR